MVYRPTGSELTRVVLMRVKLYVNKCHVQFWKPPWTTRSVKRSPNQTDEPVVPYIIYLIWQNDIMISYLVLFEQADIDSLSYGSVHKPTQ